MDAYTMIKNKYIKRLCLLLITIGTIGGLYNVISHTNTTKANWNTPYGEIINFIYECNEENNNVLVVSHNPVIDYWLEQESEVKVINIANDYQGWYEKVSEYKGTLIILDSYKGSLQTDAWLKLEEFQETSVERIMRHEKFGKDKYAWFKQILDKEYPDYYMEVYVIDNSIVNN